MGYDLLYCVRENPHAHAYHIVYLSIFLLLQYTIYDSNFSAPKRVRIFKFGIHLQKIEVYCVKENHDDIFVLPSFSLLLFSISHSSVMHREICVKNFSETAAPRILKFSTNID